MATHDVGAIAFLGRRPVTDLVGLVTPALAGAYRGGEGTLWEGLERLPEARRPDVAAVIPAWMPYLARTTWFGDALWEAGEGTAGGRPVGRDFEVRRLAWPSDGGPAWPDGNAAQNRPAAMHRLEVLGWTVVDTLDAADRFSEGGHRFRITGPAAETTVRDLGFAASEAPMTAHAVDGGREATGRFAFEMRADPGAGPALLVLRATAPAAVKVPVSVGVWRGEIPLPAKQSRFSERGTEIPATETAMNGGRLRVVLEGSGYRFYHAWLLQRIPGPPTSPE